MVYHEKKGLAMCPLGPIDGIRMRMKARSMMMGIGLDGLMYHEKPGLYHERPGLYHERPGLYHRDAKYQRESPGLAQPQDLWGKCPFSGGQCPTAKACMSLAHIYRNQGDTSQVVVRYDEVSMIKPLE